MEIVKNQDPELQQQLQDLPPGIYFLVSKAPDFAVAIKNLQTGLNSHPYTKGKLMQTFCSSEAQETPLQPGHYTMVHIICAVIKVDVELENYFPNDATLDDVLK